MSWLSPEFLNGLGVVGVVLLVGIGLVVSLVRGWVVPGRTHREIVTGKDAAIDYLQRRGLVDADTMRTQEQTTLSQAHTIENRDAVEVATTRLLGAFRDAAEARAGGGQS